MHKEHIAIINPEMTCCNCLKESKVHNIHISSLGWGSGFDNFSTQINLCDDCLEIANPEWWKLKVCGNFDEDGDYDEHGEWYEYEDEIFEFVKNMPLAGQEIFWNRYSYGACAHSCFEPQDWIDYQLGVLPHEKCKEYGYYSPEEINAYHERFPKCQHPVNKIYYDNSKGCWCPFGANGKYGQECDCNISNECYLCSYFTERITPIKDIKDYDYDDYEIYYKSKLNAEKYEAKFGNL